MLCPLFQKDCGDDCAWKIRARRTVEGVPVEEKGCVIVALARELARVNDGRSTRAPKV